MITVTKDHSDIDVSRIRPEELEPNFGRTRNVKVVYINAYGRYEPTTGYWNDIDKCFRYESNGDRINYEIVRFEELT